MVVSLFTINTRGWGCGRGRIGKGNVSWRVVIQIKGGLTLSSECYLDTCDVEIRWGLRV